MKSMKLRIFFNCILLQLFSLNLYAQSSRVDHNNRFAEFMNNPTIESFRKLESEQRVLMISSLACIPYPPLVTCPHDYNSKDREEDRLELNMQKYREVYAKGATELTPAERRKVSEYYLMNALAAPAPTEETPYFLNGKKITSGESAIENLWKDAFANDPNKSQEFICLKLITHGRDRTPAGMPREVVEKELIAMKRMENFMLTMKGRVSDNCNIQLIGDNGETVTFSIANVIHKFRSTFTNPDGSLKGKTQQPIPGKSRPISYTSYCERRDVDEVVGQFTDFQKQYPTNKTFMILRGVYDCQLTLSLRKKKSQWTVQDHLNPTVDPKSNLIPFNSSQELAELILATQLVRPSMGKYKIVPHTTAGPGNRTPLKTGETPMLGPAQR